MSQLDELLNGMSNEELAAYTANPETESHIVIGLDRYITVPESLKRIAVQGDHNIETVTFDCPRYWDGRDLSELKIFINFRCANGMLGTYLIDDVTIDTSDESMIHFNWVIREEATRAKGVLMFLVCAKITDEEGNMVIHWNSEINSEMYVSEGIEAHDDILEKNPDILTRVLLLTDITLTRAGVYVGSGDMPEWANVQVDPTGTPSEPYILTDTDKDEIKEAVKEEVPLIKTAEQPTFVNSVDECTDPEKIYVLPDGYMYAHGTKYVKQYTNLLPTLTDKDGNLYNDGIGLKDNIKINALTGEELDNPYYFSTGFIPCTVNDTIRVRGINWNHPGTEDLIIIFDSNKSRIYSENSSSSIFSVEENGDIVATPETLPKVAMAYMRLSFYTWSSTNVPDFSPIIITVNEEIIEGELEGYHNTGLVYQPMDCEDRIITLENDVVELKDDVAELKENGGGGNVTFDYSAYGLPELALTGDVSAMTKDNAVTLDYVWGERTGTCTCKWQGSSSLGYPKKNYTIKFDNAFEAVEGWGEQKKYCFKANYIDHTHARNVVSGKLWGDIVRSRNPENTTLKALPNCGAIDGFPCVITINGKYQGLYTFNIPKDGWMFGMGSGTSEAILCADAHVAATRFKGEALVDGSDFDLEYVTDEDDANWVVTSLNRLINACINSDGTDLDTTIAQYLDWESAIDYYIYTTLLGGADMTDKNYLLVTYDGVKWFFSAYDMDSTYGLYWNGKSFANASDRPASMYPELHRAMNLIYTYKKDALKARYAQLRDGALSDANVISTFSNFVCKIPERIYLSDTEVWPGIPSSAASNLAQIVNWYQTRAKIIDAQIEAL